VGQPILLRLKGWASPPAAISCSTPTRSPLDIPTQAKGALEWATHPALGSGSKSHSCAIIIGTYLFEDFMAALIDAIDIKRKNFFEFENTPYLCLEAVVNTPTARGGQTLVRLKMRNLLTNAVFEKSFKANDKFKEPDLQSVPASYLYSDGEGSHFLDQETFETLTLSEQMVGDALDFLVEGAIVELRKYNGNPIGLDLPIFVELKISETEPGVKGDTSSGSVTKSAKLETGLEIRVPLFLKEGEKVKVSTETREFGGRA
jgi:elongation factor P